MTDVPSPSDGSDREDARADLVGATAAEFRMDPLSGEWVIIAGERQSRPALPDECPFCVGGLEAPEAYTVKAFTNRWPVMRAPRELGLSEHDARRALEILGSSPATASGTPWGSGGDFLQASIPALGEAEVVLYTPDHDGSLGALSDRELCSLWTLWTQRTTELSALDHVAYVLIFENRGAEVGVTIDHPHGQIYGFPFIPPRIAREIEHSAEIRSLRGIACITCETAARESFGPRLIYQDEHCLAYTPYASAWPYAIHLVPRRHLSSLPGLDSSEAASLMRLLKTTYAAADRIFDRPLPTMMAFLQGPVATSCASGSQAAGWHLRIEVVSPMRKRDVLRYVAGAEVATSLYQNPVRPEDAAEAWRRAFERATTSL